MALIRHKNVLNPVSTSTRVLKVVGTSMVMLGMLILLVFAMIYTLQSSFKTSTSKSGPATTSNVSPKEARLYYDQVVNGDRELTAYNLTTPDTPVPPDVHEKHLKELEDVCQGYITAFNQAIQSLTPQERASQHLPLRIDPSNPATDCLPDQVGQQTI